jgi:pyruvate formate lyase activating enzyme
MRIGGFQKFSLIDYPEHIAAVLFTQSCSFRCHYCHNEELVLPKKNQPELSFEGILSFLRTRQGLLDGVVVSGGEPTLQLDIMTALRSLKELGFLVKLDTAGPMPHVLEKIIRAKLVDYIAMDIKAPLDKYSAVTNTHVDKDKIMKSINLIIHSNVKHEFRTTLVKSLHTKEDLTAMAFLIQGGQKYVLQKFKPGKTLNPKFQDEEPFSEKDFKQVLPRLERYVLSAIYR